MLPYTSDVVLYSLLVNAVVNLTMGLALLWVWLGRRNQLFARDMGAAQLAQFLVPWGYIVGQRVQPAWAGAGLALVVIGQTASILLMLRGSTRFADWKLSRSEWQIFVSLFLLVDLAVLGFQQQLALAWLIPAFLVWAGLLVTRGLHRNGSTERAVGPLMLLLGALGIGQALWTQGGMVVLQMNLASALRLALGLVLMYVALERSILESRRLHNRFQRLVERSHQGIMVCAGPHVLFANPALMAIYGFTDLAKVAPASLLQGIPADEVEQVHGHLRQLNSGRADHVQWEGLRYRQDGSAVWLRFSAWRTRWDDVKAIQFLVTDQTRRREVTQALQLQAMYDDLTGLPNRRALLQALRERCGNQPQSGPTSPSFGLVLLGIDRFKLFNEAHGLTVGDEVLQALVAMLLHEMGEGCGLMRLGADEFAFVVSCDDDPNRPQALARQVQALLQRPLLLPQHDFFIDVSMGIALFPEHAQDAESTLRAANTAMHVAKRTPGTSVALAEARFEQGSSDVLEQEQALRTAIERREFKLFYQPKVDAHTGRLTSFEALARWDSPTRGWVSPMEFIAVAERTGLIDDLGQLLLAQACEQVADWRTRFDDVVPVAINVSPLQMLGGGFPALVEGLLQRYDLPAKALLLELTESAAVSNQAEVREQILRLRALGVGVGLDDFGTGFSSLNMLRSLPVQSVKIDRGLIEPLPAPDATAVVRAVCQLAVALDLNVVAEGIETEAQAVVARAAGCHELQGFLFAQPLTPDEASQWLGYAPVAVEV